MLLGGQAAFHGQINQLFSFATNGARARLRSLYPIVTDEACHHATARCAAAWLRHTHAVTGNSVPDVSPPFSNRRPYRLQWYSCADWEGSYAEAIARATLASSSHRSYAHPAGLLRSLRAPVLPLLYCCA